MSRLKLSFGQAVWAVSSFPTATFGDRNRRARTVTIARLINTLKRQSGQEPTDEELVGLLACSPGKIRQHRNAISGAGT
jgi:hypothetical protein